MTETQPVEAKPFYKSKRFWTTILTAAAPFLPVVGPLVSQYPEAFAGIVAALFGYVGAVTTQPMTFNLKSLKRV